MVTLSMTYDTTQTIKSHKFYYKQYHTDIDSVIQVEESFSTDTHISLTATVYVEGYTEVGLDIFYVNFSGPKEAISKQIESGEFIKTIKEKYIETEMFLRNSLDASIN